MDGWTVTQGGRGEERMRSSGEEGWRKMLLWVGFSYPDPMAAPLLRWMKAPRPAVVAVTNLLRFSARLEARGRGSSPRPTSLPPDHQLPQSPPQHSQSFPLSLISMKIILAIISNVFTKKNTCSASLYRSKSTANSSWNCPLVSD